MNLYRCQNRIEKYYHHHDGEHLGFYKKISTKTFKLSKKNDVLVILVLQETKNYNLFDKNRTTTTSKAIFSMKKVDLNES